MKWKLCFHPMLLHQPHLSFLYCMRHLELNKEAVSVASLWSKAGHLTCDLPGTVRESQGNCLHCLSPTGLKVVPEERERTTIAHIGSHVWIIKYNCNSVYLTYLWCMHVISVFMVMTYRIGKCSLCLMICLFQLMSFPLFSSWIIASSLPWAQCIYKLAICLFDPTNRLEAICYKVICLSGLFCCGSLIALYKLVIKHTMLFEFYLVHILIIGKFLVLAFSESEVLSLSHSFVQCDCLGKGAYF